MYLIVGTIYFFQDVSEAPTIHAVTPEPPSLTDGK